MDALKPQVASTSSQRVSRFPTTVSTRYLSGPNGTPHALYVTGSYVLPLRNIRDGLPRRFGYAHTATPGRNTIA
jgi:hypothetical protein